MPLSSPQHVDVTERGRKQEHDLQNIRLLIFFKNWRSTQAWFYSICYFNKLSYWEVRVHHINLSWDEMTTGQGQERGRGEFGSDTTIWWSLKKLFLKPSNFIINRILSSLFTDSLISTMSKTAGRAAMLPNHPEKFRKRAVQISKQNFSVYP